MVEDGRQPNSRGYIPIIRIPIKGEMTVPNIGSLDPGTYVSNHLPLKTKVENRPQKIPKQWYESDTGLGDTLPCQTGVNLR